MKIRRFPLGERIVDLERAVVEGRSTSTTLTPNEVGLLQLLVDHAGRTVDRDQLLTEGLGYRKALRTRAIDQAIWRLRRKLEDEGQEPRYLISDLSSGYRLALGAPTSPVFLLGRSGELEGLLRWVDQGAPEIWLAGLPGSGRSTLARAVDAARPHHTTRWRVSTAMPAEGTLWLRAGPLPPDAGRELLHRSVAAARGTAAPEPDELAAFDALAETVDHHPASLVALGQRSVSERSADLVATPLPSIRTFVADQRADLVRAVGGFAVYPDPFDAADVEGLGSTGGVLNEAWQHMLCEGHGGWFRILAPVRQVLAEIAPVPADVERRFVARITQQVAPVVAEVRTRADDTSRSRIQAWARRIEAAVLRSPADDDLLAAWFVSGPNPKAAASIRPVTANGRALVALARGEPVAAEPLDDWVALQVLRVGFQQALAASETDLEPWVDQARALAERAPSPQILANLHQTRGIVRGRQGGWDEATRDLLEALAIHRRSGATAHAAQLLQNLAALASRDGRAREAVAWCQEALDTDPDPSREAGYRDTLATLAVAAGDRAEAERQVELLELLEADPAGLLTHRAVLDLLGGRPERAFVALSSELHGPSHEAERRDRQVLVCWSRLLLGDPVGARVACDRLAPSLAPVSIRHRHMLRLTRAVVAALEGDTARAEAEVAGLEPGSARNVPAIRQLVAAFVARARGTAVDVEQLEADLAAGGVGDVTFQLALHVLRGRLVTL